jgi:pyruvate dehydrogenase E2 component (dihydrolipoamide acetyltransferase)
MATEVKLPRLGQGMESGTIVRWLKAEGDSVKKREPLYELDTDKVTQEVESEVDGVLLEIVVKEGEVEVGSTIAMIENGDAADTASPDSAAATAEEPAVAEAAEPAASAASAADGAAAAEPAATTESTSIPMAAKATGARIKASPLARRIARERGVDLAALAGTGPDGRIVADDVENAPVGGAQAAGAPTGAAAPAPEGDVEVVTMTGTRRTIARRLTEAWQAPVFQLGVSIDMTEALHLREQMVERLGEGDVKPTVNDLLTRFVGVALVRHRTINATFSGEEIHRHASAHVGLAVAAPNGLVVPVIRNVDRSSVQEIARARAELVGRAREGKLTREDMDGGTFTISNLGMFGVEQFVAVLNPPQVAILAVGAVKPTPIVVEGEVDVAPMMYVTLTCDHRAIDGADGAEFLRTLVSIVEQPALAL